MAKREVSMQRFRSKRNLIMAACVAVFLLLFLVLWLQQRSLTRDLANTRQNLQAAKTQAEANNRLIYNEIDYRAQLEKLTVLPKEGRLLLPELGLSVPSNNRTRALLYSFEDGAESGAMAGEVRVTTAYMTDHQFHRLSCNDMVRLKIEDTPNAYSPDQPSYGTVILSDNRKLQIYASTTKTCATAWKLETPQKIADEFKNAALY